MAVVVGVVMVMVGGMSRVRGGMMVVSMAVTILRFVIMPQTVVQTDSPTRAWSGTDDNSDPRREVRWKPTQKRVGK